MDGRGSKQGWEMYDCGCVKTRPTTSKYYARRWKVYMTNSYMILKCMDCGVMKYYRLRSPAPEITRFATK